MIVEKYYVKDIKEYEESTGKSVISILKEHDFDGLVDLIRLGIPRKPSKDTCYDILDSYLLQGHDLLDVFEEVRQCLFGDQMTEEEFMDYVSSDYVPQPHIKAMFDEGHLSGNYVDKIHDYFRKNGGLRTRICFELISLFKNNHKKIEKEDE